MEKPLTGKHVLIILLSAFGVVFAVNGFFLYSALHTHSGELRGGTYEAGLHYNATLAEQRAQNELHWSHKSEALLGSRLAVTFVDASGAPLTGLAVDGWLERPASNRADRKLTFTEVNAGRYETSALPEAGTWIFAFTAQKAQSGTAPAIYHAKERLRIAPAH